MKNKVSSTAPARVLAVPILCWLVLFQLGAQPSVNTQAFFTQMVSNTIGKSPGDQVDVPAMPWIESYELRTETRDFDFEQQEYTLRLSPSTRRKNKAQRSLYLHQESMPDFEGQELACEVLVQRYNDWLELYLIDREASLLNRLALVINDRATVLNRQALGLDFDWSELVALREDQTDLRLRQTALDRLKQRLLAAYGLSGRQNFEDMVGLVDIRRRLDNSEYRFSDPETDYELEQIARELELERAEQRQYFDFAQVRYQGPHSDPGRERFSVGVGLKFPFSGNQIVKIRELEMEEAALREEVGRDRAVESTDHATRLEELVAKLDHYDFTVATFAEEREELARIAGQMQKKAGFDPLPLLKIKERGLRNELRQLGLLARLYQDYLDLAEQSGELCTATAGELLLR